MKAPITFEPLDGTIGFVAVGEDEITTVRGVCGHFLNYEPHMDTNARHPEHTPMFYVAYVNLAEVVLTLTQQGHYVTFKGRRQS